MNHIRKAIEGFQREKSLKNLNVNDRAHLLKKKTIKNIS